MKETKFKNTEIGKIPEEWEVNTLAELCSQITDGSHESPKDTEYGFYMPSVKDMRINEFNFANCKKISRKDYVRLINNGCKPQKGDVLIAKDGSILKYCFTLKEDLPIVILSSIAIIRPCPTEIDSEYLALYFRQPQFIEQVLADFKTGTGVPRIVLRNFEKIQISYPYDLTEQHNIASALTSIDNLISSLNKLIEKKKNIKQGAMQQLLTGKIRLKGFNEPWVEHTIEELFDLGNGYTPSKSNPAYWTNGTIPWFRMEDIRTNGRILKDSIQHVTPEAVKGNGLYPKYSIILSTTATIGEHALLIADSLANQQFTFLNRKVNRRDMIDIIFFYHYCFILGKWCRDNINAGGLLAVNMEDLKNHSIYIPKSIAEQQAIATILTKMDDAITALEAKKAKYEAIKQGMMQQLLTGKIRLIN